MNANQIAAYKILEQAQLALKSGDKNMARQLASQAAQLAPDLEEVWLLMAALASPQGSVAHLEKALQINPGSERAQKGLAWARGRLQADQSARTLVAQPLATVVEQSVRPVSPEKVVEPRPSVTVIPEAPAKLADTAPRAVKYSDPVPQEVSTSAPAPQADTAPQPASSANLGKETLTRSRYSYIIPLVVVICLVLAWVIWKGVLPVSAFFNSSEFISEEHGPAWAEVSIAKSNATLPALQPDILSTEKPTHLPTETLAPIIESVNSGLATVTTTPQATSELPSLTPLPTEVIPSATVQVLPTDVISTFTPNPPIVQPTEVPPTEIMVVPTATFVPTSTEVIQPSATPDLNTAPTPTPLPTDTSLPGPTQYVPPTINPNTGDSKGGARWIDVDLTHQMVYAYEGNTIVNSFLVSTGTWQHPTVTGQYHVYVKYRYTDMSGPGYYLPNVPYTMYFYQGYALHGTYWHSNFGTPMSHGCVNLSIPDSEWVYNFASVGTLVNVHN